MKTLLKDELPQGRFWNKAWSLVEGCTPISPGCANCWLAGLQNRNLPNMAKGLINPGSKHFNGLIKCHEDRLDIPLHRRKPTVYAIWSDLFHEGVSPEFRMRAFSVMAMRPRHHFIIVTKRPAEASDFLAGTKEMWRDILAHKAGSWFGDDADCFVANSIEGVCGEGYNVGWPLSNVTILVTMEDQQRANERAPEAHLLSSMGWRVGALCEPLLGAVDLSKHLCCKDPIMPQNAFDWIITGGESGPGARPAHEKWIRSLRDQAKAAEVPFLFKSWGEWQPWNQNTVDDDPEQTRFLTMEWSGDEWVDVGYPAWCDDVDGDNCTARVGKRRSGRILDGREHLGVPE